MVKVGDIVRCWGRIESARVWKINPVTQRVTVTFDDGGDTATFDVADIVAHAVRGES